MRALLQQLENPTCQPQPTFDRLVGIGVRPEGDRCRPVTARAELAPQQGDRVGLVEELRLEVAAGGQPEPCVGRARIAVDAAVLASPVGVDGAIEGHVRRHVARDHPPARVHLEAGRRAPDLVERCIERAPAVVDVVPRPRFITPAPVGERPPAADDDGLRGILRARLRMVSRVPSRPGHERVRIPEPVPTSTTSARRRAKSPLATVPVI